MIDQWAEQILLEIYHVTEDKRIECIKEQLLKAIQLGYTESLDNYWWVQQDQEMLND